MSEVFDTNEKLEEVYIPQSPQETPEPKQFREMTPYTETVEEVSAKKTVR